ncbi:cation diffusion facilitator family transporter [Bacillus massiliigorillae]|uniref:cation diffusion facilitator family transporter n=1 Tax=Bacillus massiliigorillae TaxID=1243664 RepID=UPI0003A37089|nr:cation diffusion facilitator family transporter [Bacillus massiliigorillae]
MGHHHGHSHSHDHHHHHSSNKKALRLAFFLIASFMFVEVIGGFLTNSLALLSDAGHMLSDAAALGLSLVALLLGEKKATQQKTFGYRRFEIIAAALNGITLILISGYIFYEAFQRFQHPPEIQSMGMLLISVIGLLVNIAAAFILMNGNKEENLNIRSAYLHVLGDMLGSVGAIAAAVLIYFFGWGWADPLASIIVAILIIISGIRVTKDAFHILMEGAPAAINPSLVKEELQRLTHVIGVHDLHIWSITSELPMLSCHLEIENNGNHDEVLRQVQKLLLDAFHIEHSTIQIEREEVGCPNTQLTCN